MNNTKLKNIARNLGGNADVAFAEIVGGTDVCGGGVIDKVARAGQNIYASARELTNTVYRQTSLTVRDGAKRGISVTREKTALAVLRPWRSAMPCRGHVTAVRRRPTQPITGCYCLAVA